MNDFNNDYPSLAIVDGTYLALGWIAQIAWLEF